MPRDIVWPADAKQALRMQGRFYGEPIKCMACTAAEVAQAQYTNQPHDEYGIHYIIRDHDEDEIMETVLGG